MAGQLNMDTKEMDMQLDSHAATHAKRFVVEDSITKVTSDGEPHGLMTMVAGLGGLLAAVLILGVVIFLVVCRQHKKNQPQESQSGTPLSNASSPAPPLTGNLNAAFAESTLSLSSGDPGKQPKPTLNIIKERF